MEKPSLVQIYLFIYFAYALILLELRKAMFNTRTWRCLLIGYVYDIQKLLHLVYPYRKHIFNSKTSFASTNAYHSTPSFTVAAKPAASIVKFTTVS